METINIEDYIPHGRENAVTRLQLRQATGLNDRWVRKHIQTARQRGVIIANEQNGAGYYQTDDIEEIAAQFRQNRSRAMTILTQQKHLRRRLKAAGVSENWRLQK